MGPCPRHFRDHCSPIPYHEVVDCWDSVPLLVHARALREPGAPDASPCPSKLLSVPSFIWMSTFPAQLLPRLYPVDRPVEAGLPFCRWVPPKISFHLGVFRLATV